MILDPAGDRLYLLDGLGTVYAGDAQAPFEPLAAWCLPAGGWGALAISEDDGQRWLVASGSGNRVMRHPLP
jgi:hypothetical protein